MFIGMVTNMESQDESKLLESVTLLQPTAIAIIAAITCGIGYILFTTNLNATSFAGLKLQKTAGITIRQLGVVILTGCLVFVLILLVTNSISIALAISSLATGIPFLINKQRAESLLRARENAWPEAIDSLVSALQSGVSISEAILTLADHGPYLLQPSFQRIREGVRAGVSFENILLREKEILKSPISDQVFETLLVAKEFGGKDSNNALRLLSEFIRDDIDMLEEIRTKFGWIRNSAALATAAPWLLLILLSSQKSTVTAFATSSGISMLLAGVLMTVLAYFWMERVGRLPIAARALR